MHPRLSRCGNLQKSISVQTVDTKCHTRFLTHRGWAHRPTTVTSVPRLGALRAKGRQKGSRRTGINAGSGVLPTSLLPSLLRRKIDEQDVRIFPQPVEDNPVAVGTDIKCPHRGGTIEPGQTL